MGARWLDHSAGGTVELLDERVVAVDSRAVLGMPVEEDAPACVAGPG